MKRLDIVRDTISKMAKANMMDNAELQSLKERVLILEQQLIEQAKRERDK